MTEAAAHVINDKYQMVSVKRLKPHPKNPRKGNVGMLREMIRSNGFHGALVVQKSSGHILAGNHRFLAARDEGMTKVPVLWADVDDKTALRILLADNKASDAASTDQALLAGIFEGMDDYVGTGFKDDEIERILKAAEAPDEFPEFGEDIETKHECPKCGYEFS